ncbi:MAG TPA: hypothetical protein VKZ82_11980 [Nonomuraea sp.]|uniref:hypothetical protein n=1 Tax=Nonomuraea sp. NPDC049649 TaxID=3155776 RepID=UPI002C688E51|nr:hypothetical protein [Nonomuraea sp.]
MLAIVAAIVFGLGFLLELLDAQIAGNISGMAFVLLGLALLALHQGGVGTAGMKNYGGWRGRARR